MLARDLLPVHAVRLEPKLRRFANFLLFAPHGPGAPPEVNATILAYFVVAAFTVLAYVAWKRRMVSGRLGD